MITNQRLKDLFKVEKVITLDDESIKKEWFNSNFFKMIIDNNELLCSVESKFMIRDNCGYTERTLKFIKLD